MITINIIVYTHLHRAINFVRKNSTAFDKEWCNALLDELALVFDAAKYFYIRSSYNICADHTMLKTDTSVFTLLDFSSPVLRGSHFPSPQTRQYLSHL